MRMAWCTGSVLQDNQKRGAHMSVSIMLSPSLAMVPEPCFLLIRCITSSRAAFCNC